MKNILTYVTYIIFSSIGVYFFHTKYFNSTGFIVYLCSISLLGLAFYGFDRLKVLDLRNLKIYLNKLEETKKEVYAKVDELQLIMVDLADIYIYSAFKIGRFTEEEGSKLRKIVKERDNAKQLLKNANISSEEICLKIDPINQYIINYILIEIDRKIYDIISEREKKRTGKIQLLQTEFDKNLKNKINAVMSNSGIVSAIKEHLIEKNISVDDFKNDLHILYHFLENEKLPPEEK